VWAVDDCASAVALARVNAARHQVADRVHVIHGDLLAHVPDELDLVVANLPYLPAGEHRPEYDAEPAHAIYAPGDGRTYYRRLSAEAHDLLVPGGAVLVQYRGRVVELGPTGAALAA
jgi:methylase of polypeptide subunit release factors